MEKLKELAYAEATLLKHHATKQELEKLDFSNIRPDSFVDCIYGQMTGNCYSLRAIDLLRKCCKDVSFRRVYSMSPAPGLIFDNVDRRSYSPIEVFIYYTDKEGIRQLIEYLKS